MTLTRLPTDGAEWTLYGVDMFTPISILRPLTSTLKIKKNEPGAGDITLRYEDPILSSLAVAQFVGLNYRGIDLGGFFVETPEWTDVSAAEYSGRALKINGRGPLSLVDDAIVWDWMTPGMERIRKFGSGDSITTYGGAPIGMGRGLWHLLSEARDYQLNAAAQTLERYCWRVGNVIAGAVQLEFGGAFTETTDSNGAGWPDAADFEYAVGTSLLEVLMQIAAFGYDFNIVKNTVTNAWDLYIYGSWNGTDRSALNGVVTPIIFRVGLNCTEATGKITGGEIRTASLVEYAGALPYVAVPPDPYTPPPGSPMLLYRRRETLLRAANASTDTTAALFGQAGLNVMQIPNLDTSIEIDDAVGPRYGIDYTVNDDVSYDKGWGGGVPQKIRLVGATLSWAGNKKYAKIALEVA